MIEWLALTPAEVTWLALITFGAGVVRGFSGFALSALVMATAVLILPPVELFPMLWWMELSASLLMVRGGWADANRKTTLALVTGSAIGWPLGLWFTTSVSVTTSKMVALSIIVTLAVMQLAKIRLAFLATRPGLYGTGLLAGVISGLAHVGGLIIALYVLASDAPARQMRGSLVLFLFLGSITSMITLLAFGVMDFSGVVRGLTFAVPTMLGVFIGQQFFTERLAPYYRAFCLTLLIALAALGLVRTALA